MPRRPVSRTLSYLACALALAVLALPIADAHAERRRDALSTAATGLIAPGEADVVWAAATLDIDEGAEVDDPAADSAGFVIVADGAVLATLDEQTTLLDEFEALFVPAGSELSIRAVDDDAEIWRIAAGEDDEPFADTADLGDIVIATSPGDAGAGDGAVRKATLKLGYLEDEESIRVGNDGLSIPFVIALDDDLLVDDAPLDEGEIAAGSAVRPGDVTLTADGNATLAYVTLGPALDPVDLSAGPAKSPSPGATKTPAAQPTVVAPPTAQPTATAATSADADGDGLTAADEELRLTDPNNPDTDGDGLSDGREVFETGTNPLDPDGDDDGVNDGDEIAAGTNPNLPELDPTADNDNDRLSNGRELTETRTDPNNPDSDFDGLDDFFEVNLGTDPTRADTDGDTLNDGDELNVLGTDPRKLDTDGDTYSDNAELGSGHDPGDLNDHP